MTGWLPTFKKELLSYCVSPVSWLIAVLFYLWRGFELSQLTRFFAAAHYDRDLLATASYQLQSTFLMVILVPGILTMRCFAEERRTGSIETLMTAPVSDGGVVFGKWAAAVGFYALLWLPSVVLLQVLQLPPFLDADLASGPMVAAYLGMFLLAGLLLAFGCFASSLTDNLLLAALLAILFDLALLTLPNRMRIQLGVAPDDYYANELFDKLDVMGNFGNWFARGLVDTSQVVFYLGGIAFFLFLTSLSLGSRRLA